MSDTTVSRAPGPTTAGPPELSLELAREQRRVQRLRREVLALRGAILRPAKGQGRAHGLALLAGVAQTMRDFDDAVRGLEAAVAIEPANGVLWTRLATARRNAGALDAAQQAADRALELAPTFRTAMREAATIAARRGDRARMRATLDAMRIADDDVGGLVFTARMADIAGDDELLDRTLPHLVEADPASVDGLLAAARLHWRAGDVDAALALLGGSEPGRAARVELALAERDTDALSAAVAALEQPDSKQLRRCAGHLRARGRLRDAVAVLDHPGLDAAGLTDVRHDRGRLEGDLAVYGGRWAAGPAPYEPVEPVPGRILHLFGRSRPYVESGYAVRGHQVLRAQRAVGLDAQAVTQIGFPETEVLASEESFDAISYHRLAPGERYDRLDVKLAANLEALGPVVERLRPMLLAPASDLLNAELALALRERYGVPVLYEVRGFWEESWLSNQPDEQLGMSADAYALRRDAETRCMVEADHIVTLGTVMKQQIVERGVAPERVSVIPNAIVPEDFPVPPRDEILAEHLGLAEADVVVGYISSVTAYEGIDDLLRATAMLREQGLAVGALIVGDGNQLPELQALAGELGLGEGVVFTGRVPHAEILAYYGQIDIFVVPRRAHRVCELVTPLKPYEALATQRPVVVSDIAALREIVTDGQTGRTFRAQDPEDLARVIGELFDDPDQCEALARAGREWVLAERTWQRNGERYREVLSTMGLL